MRKANETSATGWGLGLRIRTCALLGFALLVGCLGCAGSKGRTISLSELEATPSLRSNLWVELTPGSEIALCSTESLGADVLEAAPELRRGRLTFRVGPAAGDDPVINCKIVSGQTGGYFTPDMRLKDVTVPGAYVPERTTRGHARSRMILARTIRETSSTLVCMVGPSPDLSTYFCRHLGIESHLKNEIGDSGFYVHPGYGVISQSNWWLVVPKVHVSRFETLPPDFESANDSLFAAQYESGAEKAEAWLRSKLQEGELEEWLDRRTATPIAAAYSIRGRDEESLRVVRENIQRKSKDKFGMHEDLASDYLLLTLIQIAHGDVDAAENSYAYLLHMISPQTSLAAIIDGNDVSSDFLGLRDVIRLHHQGLRRYLSELQARYELSVAR